ncbi:putative ABC transport system permease protein [Caldicellulosiruptor bescii]|uniref:ABC3 transporter permease protein domain-containing protein n=2 Tax=Caldicellulosiruptor bescii TaxID=31899 RepID=B9MLQ9_CALBD|nr:FtsX-like permease family protein [Caldicellulosiruptor bescii]ACM59267.1 protein of unknown function DUF214 [Caldicellulosiruptor bescii DSM 6725]PBC88276.1 putative ABC transport system permease protein [Caldicellulosiruptor bescii]PBC92243.1 putative ABC transport system permease protein [Caldicellulosiruptor bescii]PBD04948.1 putative ABC transport system permease protein [Caldicellulosiruptor bescii]PBD05422.1 putative ABC transport system permease protein [Caldicellulosiruptor bescii]
MKFSDILSLIVTNIKRRKLRTALTVMGIFIGSLGLFVVVSISTSFKDYIVKGISSLGNADVIYVMPNTNAGYTLEKLKTEIHDKDIKKLEKLRHVKFVIPFYFTNGNLKFKKFEGTVTLVATSVKEFSKKYTLQFGRFPKDDNESGCILGYGIAKLIANPSKGGFADENEVKKLVNKAIKIESKRINQAGEEETKEFSFKIRGIAKSDFNFDSSIILPMKAMDKIEDWRYSQQDFIKKTGYTYTFLVVDSPSHIPEVEKFLEREKYYYTSIKEQQEVIEKFLNAVKIIVGGIGAISLVVAAFGIANTMIMAILERRKEIGIFKVLGASSKNILLLFLFESGFLGFLGGVFSVIAGFALNFLIGLVLRARFPAINDFSIGFNIPLALFVLCISTLVGIIAGIYPAKKAVSIEVISALKEE